MSFFPAQKVKNSTLFNPYASLLHMALTYASFEHQNMQKNYKLPVNTLVFLLG